MFHSLNIKFPPSKTGEGFYVEIVEFLFIFGMVLYLVLCGMANSTKLAEQKQKLVGVPSEESKKKYKEDSEKALDRMQLNQPRKKSIVKDRRTALRARGFYPF